MAEFLKACTGGKKEKELFELHGELVKHGFRFRPQNIIGARPTLNTARNGHRSPMQVTYNSPETKSVVIKATKAAHVWNTREKKEKGKLTNFKEVPTPKRLVQVKRKHKDTSDEKESKPKRAKTEPI